MNMANAHFNLGETEEALALWDEAALLSPDGLPYNGWFWRAMGEVQSWDLRAARESMRESARRRPTWQALHRLGGILILMSDLQGAQEAYEKAMELKPGDPGLLASRAYLSLVKEDIDRAEDGFRAALALLDAVPNSQGQWCHHWLGHILAGRGKFGEAQEEFERCVGADPGLTGLHRIESDVEEMKTMLTLEAEGPAILKGDLRPSDPVQALACARYCANKDHFVAAGRYLDRAISPSALPSALEELGHRDMAVRSYLLGAAGEGKDASSLEPSTRPSLRNRALDLLRAFLARMRAKLDEGSGPGRRTAYLRSLVDMEWGRAFGSVRDENALAALPPEEAADWRAFWKDVKALRERAWGKE
jgi:hypothetical protein